METSDRDGSVNYGAPAADSALRASMDVNHIDKSVALHIVTSDSQHEDVLRHAKTIDSDRIVSFGSVSPTSVHALEYVWKISDEELKGINLHPAIQKFDLDDVKILPVFDLARTCGLVVLIHMGFNHSHTDESVATPQALVGIMKNFPGLKIVATHMSDMRVALDMLTSSTDLYMDTACAAHCMNSGLFRDIIGKHGADRILFGSNYPRHLPAQNLELIQSLDISEEDKQLILGGNAVRLLGF